MKGRRSLFGSAIGAVVLAACSSPSSDTRDPAVRPGLAPEAPSQAAPAAPVEETILVRNAHGTMEGTLLLPGGSGPHPVVCIIAGSGPTDRDGNQPELQMNARPYRLLADELAKSNIGSLRYDKAGIGASTGALRSEAELRFTDSAEDAARFVEALRVDPRVGKLTLVGHSEGSLVGMLAARRAPIDAFVSVAGAGRPASEVLREQLAKNLSDSALLQKANEILAALERGEHVDDVPPALATLFRPSVQGYLISWLELDPATELRDMPALPVLVAQGTTDIQIGVGDAERLARARPSARLVVIEGMNHVLKMTSSSQTSQKDAYTNPDLPLAPELTQTLVGFVAR